MTFPTNKSVKLETVITEQLGTNTYVKVTSKGDYLHEELSLPMSIMTLEGVSVGDHVIVTVEVAPSGLIVDKLSVASANPAAKANASPIEVEIDTIEGPVHSSDEFYISDDDIDTLNVVNSIMEAEGKAVLLLTGPSGWGKTLMGYHLANMMHKQHIEVNMPVLMEAEELFGIRTFEDNKSFFKLHDYVHDIEDGDCVLVLDEITRTEMFKLGPALSLMDARGMAIVHNQRIKVGEGTLIIMTANEGWRYTGTETIDEAFVNRAHAVLNLCSIPIKEEAKLLVNNEGVNSATAKKIANFMAFLRGYEDTFDASLRMSSFIAKQIKHGATLEMAVNNLILNRSNIEDQMRKEIADNLGATSS